MIVVNLMGGLGNQMFQYAAGRALALKHNVPLYLDRTFLDTPSQGKWTMRSFELDLFPVQIVPLPGRKGKWLQRIHSTKVLRRFYSRSIGRRRWAHFSEEVQGYDSAFLRCPSQTFLHGYFQSEKYFLDCESQIRSDFRFPEPVNERNKELLNVIDRSELSISVHVRRGDYVTLHAAGQFHGTVEQDYYLTGAERILRSVSGTPRFFVFSDDPDWVRSELHLPGEKIVVDWNAGRNSFEDMRLMSRCRHHIIANSSFSWWGAWLNPSSDKIVIAPSVWFKGTTQQPVDLIPESWIRI